MADKGTKLQGQIEEAWKYAMDTVHGIDSGARVAAARRTAAHHYAKALLSWARVGHRPDGVSLEEVREVERALRPARPRR